MPDFRDSFKKQPELLAEPDSSGIAAKFFSGAMEGAINKPVRGIKQALNSSTESTGASVPSSADTAQSKAKADSGLVKGAGEVLGTLVPFIALSAATRGASLKLFGTANESSISRIAAEQATAGFALGTLLTPSELKKGDSLWAARLHQGATDAATFATMGSTSSFLSKKLPGTYNADLLRTVGSRAAIGAVSGGLGGFVDAELRSGFTASKEDVFSSMLGYAVFGAAMEGGGAAARRYLGSNLHQTAANEKISAEPSANQAGAGAEREVPILSAQQFASRDANVEIISQFGGWYDKLAHSIRNAKEGQTIIVTQEKWLKEGHLLLKSHRRPDVNLVFDASKVSTPSLPPVEVIPARLTGAAAQRQGIEPISSSRTDSAQGFSVKDGPALRKAIEAEVLRSGLDPAEALIESLKKNRVLMIGEFHTPDNPHRALGAELMPALRKAGATHLAIEHSIDHKGNIFDKLGEVNRDQFTSIMAQPEYLRLLKSARSSGLEVVPIDSAEASLAAIRQQVKTNSPQLNDHQLGSEVTAATLSTRNMDMAREINKILVDPNAKVVFWVGNYHLNTAELPGEGPQVMKILRSQKVPVVSFASDHDPAFTYNPRASVYTPPRALAVPMKEAPVLSQQTTQSKGELGQDTLFFGQFDYLLTYPAKGYSYD